VHELSIVEALIEQVEKEVQRSGHQGRITRLDLVIGRLSGVNADSIRFAFTMLAPGTLVADAALEITEPKAVCCCQICGRAADIDEISALCPHCGSGEVTIEGGQELILESIELDGS
jgi:hydrogenase nickel incorporation protein HypA/HybF